MLVLTLTGLAVQAVSKENYASYWLAMQLDDMGDKRSVCRAVLFVP